MLYLISRHSSLLELKWSEMHVPIQLLCPHLLEMILKYKYLDENVVMALVQKQYTAKKIDEETYNICLNNFFDN